MRSAGDYRPSDWHTSVPQELEKFVGGAEVERLKAENKRIQAMRVAEQRIKHVMGSKKLTYAVKDHNISARVSRHSLPVRAKDGSVAHTRFYRHEVEGEDRYGILYDLTPGEELVTTNLYGLEVQGSELVISDDFNNGIVVDPNDDVYQHFIKAADAIWSSAQEDAEQKKKAIKKRVRALGEFASDKWENLKDHISLYEDEYFYGTTATVATLVGVGTTVAIVANTIPVDIDDSPATVEIGGEVSPGFSQELRESEVLADENIGNLGKGINENNLDTDKLRDIFLQGEAGKCFVYPIDDDDSLTLDSELNVWNDSVRPDGTPRSDDFTVTLSTEELEVCYNPEDPATADPNTTHRLVVELVESNEEN